MKVYLGDAAVTVTPAMILGQGGEADVYALPDGRALKLFKTPAHPDLRELPDARAAATARLAEHQHKLPALLALQASSLPERLVAPQQLATARRRGAIAGYAMRRIDAATALHRYAEPRYRRGVSGNAVLGILRDLHTTLAATHAAGIVIGDLNDLNVLVARGRAFVIDTDSVQFGIYPCRVYTERFIDPRLCAPDEPAPRPIAAHTEATDWYAFSVIAMQSLLAVGPFGGVHKPADPRRRVPAGRRALARLTVFDAKVMYPKPALPLSQLPDELLGYFDDTFARDRREPFPGALLDRLRYTRCGACGTEHARDLCPGCAAHTGRAVRKLVAVRGGVTARTVLQTEGVVLDAAVVGGRLDWRVWERGWLHDASGQRLQRVALSPELEAHERRRNAAHDYWLAAGTLYRDGALGPVAIGQVLAGRTRFWVGARFGLGFYDAGGLHLGFAFDAERRGLLELPLPPRRGAVIAAHAAIADERAWLLTLERDGARLLGRCTLVTRDGRVLASALLPADDGSWIAAMRTATAAGEQLFVATDGGIVRIERDGDSVAATRIFGDTEPFVNAATRLHTTDDGIYAVHRDRIVQLTL